MKRAVVIVWLAATSAVVGAAAPAEAQATSVEAIVLGSAEFDGIEITVEGELVGDYGNRDDGTTWAQLNGGSYVTMPLREGGARSGSNTGIGVMIPAGLAEGLDPAGGYGTRGPVVSLTGVWHHHDPDRGGESYLEVVGLDVIEEGRALSQPIAWWPLLAGLGFFGAAITLRVRSSTGES